MPNTQYKTATDIVSRKNQDGTVIIMKMDDSNNFFKINGIAAEIWNQMANAESLDSIKKNILNSYDVTNEALEKDVTALLNTLTEKKLIEKC